MAIYSDYLSNRSIRLFDLFGHSKKSVATRRSYLIEVNLFAEYIKKDILSMTENDCRDYVNYLINRVKNGVITYATFSKKYKYLFAFFTFIEEQREDPSFSNFLAYIPFKEPSIDIDAKRILAPDKFNDFMDYVYTRSYRDYVIGLLVYFIGLRTSELERLKKEQIVKVGEDFALKVVRYREDVYLKFPNEVAFALFDYINKVNPESIYVFSSSRGKARPIGSAAIQKNFRKYSDAYFKGVEAYTLSDIRHSGALYAYMSGASLDAIKDTLGIYETKYMERYENLAKVVDKEAFGYCDFIKVRGYFSKDDEIDEV